MSKTTPLNSKVSVVRSAKLPVARKLSPPDLRPFNAFVAKCDDLVEQYAELANLRSDEASAWDTDDTRNYHKPRISECEEGLAQFNPEHRYNDDGDLDRDFIADRLAIMMGAIPNVNPHAPEAFPRMLIAHVQAFDGLDALVLESACREIEQTMKFTPAIAELLDALKKHATLWSKRREAIRWLERRFDNVIVALFKAEAEERAKAIARQVYAVQQAQRALIEVRKRQLGESDGKLIDLRKREVELDAKLREEKGRLFDLEYADAEAIDVQIDNGRKPPGHE
jgi:hypothetical protein